MRRFYLHIAFALVAACVLNSIPASRAHAQADLGSAWSASRAELERRLLQLDALAASTAYSERARVRSAAESEVIRRRLSEGDFRVGDRIYVEIEATILLGPQAIAQTTGNVQDTVTVLEDSRITVRGIGEISLRGVLRSELQTRVSDAVGEVILNARTATRPLVRLAVFGAVGRPGYYTVPVETRIDDLVMLAGGPTIDASTGNMRMMRGDTVVLDEKEVRALISEGAVVGSIGLAEGDQLVIEQRTQRLDRQQTLQYTFLFLSPIVSSLVFRAVR
jgi:protein involved in polysaccharide export with SLBB domain